MHALSPSQLSTTCRSKARELGLELCGFTSVDAELRKNYYEQWIAEGQHGEMRWMENNNDRRLDPSKLLPEARTLILLGLNYYQAEPPMQGRVSKYALGKDYHKILLKKLKHLCLWMQEQGGIQRPYVDTGPILEKALAEKAGLGWMGKNTLLINRKLGSYLFLGTIVTTLAFEQDAFEKNRCGNCTRCIDACPTGAITAPYQLDARRCIAYLTIEHQGPIPLEFRTLIGDHLYGCDDCLDCCPWNRWAQTTHETRFRWQGLPRLRDTLAWDEDTFRERFQGTPIMRLKLPRWKRNTCIVLGNTGNTDDLPSLETLTASEDPMLAEHATWAIQQINSRQ